MTQQSLYVKGLACHVGGELLFSDVSFELKRGQAVAILGPNGSGKSTLIRTILGIQNYAKGVVCVGEENFRDLSDAERAKRMTWMPQFEEPVEGLSALEAVLMGRYVHHTGLFASAEDVRVANQALDRVGLNQVSDRTMPQLSGGERQRVWLARCFAQQAPTIVADEPTSSQDLHQVSLVTQVLKEFVKQGGSLLVATHDLNFVTELGATVYAIKDSKWHSLGQSSSPDYGSRLKSIYGESILEVDSYWVRVRTTS